MYAETAHLVMAYCLRHTGPQAAEDAVAETFAVAWRRRGRLPSDPMPWLIVTARNTLAAHARGEARQRRVAERVAPLTQLATTPPDMDDSRRQELLTVLESLPLADREAILLVAWDGLTTRDAARVLGVTPGALRVRIHRAAPDCANSTPKEPIVIDQDLLDEVPELAEIEQLALQDLSSVAPHWADSQHSIVSTLIGESDPTPRRWRWGGCCSRGGSFGRRQNCRGARRARAGR